MDRRGARAIWIAGAVETTISPIAMKAQALFESHLPCQWTRKHKSDISYHILTYLVDQILSFLWQKYRRQRGRSGILTLERFDSQRPSFQNSL